MKKLRKHIKNDLQKLQTVIQNTEGKKSKEASASVPTYTASTWSEFSSLLPQFYYRNFRETWN